MAKSQFIATILLLGSSLRVSNYRRRAECAPRLPSERRRSRSPHGTAVGGNQTHLPASATNEVVELGTARVSAFWADYRLAAAVIKIPGYAVDRWRTERQTAAVRFSKRLATMTSGMMSFW